MSVPEIGGRGNEKEINANKQRKGLLKALRRAEKIEDYAQVEKIKLAIKNCGVSHLRESC